VVVLACSSSSRRDHLSGTRRTFLLEVLKKIPEKKLLVTTFFFAGSTRVASAAGQILFLSLMVCATAKVSSWALAENLCRTYRLNCGCGHFRRRNN
jgi:hypothetical protein